MSSPTEQLAWAEAEHVQQVGVIAGLRTELAATVAERRRLAAQLDAATADNGLLRDRLVQQETRAGDAEAQAAAFKSDLKDLRAYAASLHDQLAAKGAA